MRFGVAVALLCTMFPHIGCAQAQGEAPAKVPVVPEAKDKVNPEAMAALDAMRARYGELRSYSDKVEVHLENAEKWLTGESDRLKPVGTLAFERPDKLRFEGKNPRGAFVLVNDGTNTYILNPEHPGEWLQRPQDSPLNLRDDFSRSNAGFAVGTTLSIDAGWTDVGTTLAAGGLLMRPQSWMEDRDRVVVASFEGDEAINGEDCRVVRIVEDYGEGNRVGSRLWIAKSDGLLRRFERSFGEGKDAVRMIETHSEVHPNPSLPADTWKFVASTEAKVTDRFPPPYPVAYGLKAKVGDALPVFSQDGLNDEPVELNPKSGKATILFFFFANLASADGPSLQRLQTALGEQKLDVVATAGDNERKRVESLIEKAKLRFPIYYDQKGYRNQLAYSFGVKGWPLVLLYDREAKLKAIAQRPGDEEFIEAICQQFPAVKKQTILDALMGSPTP